MLKLIYKSKCTSGGFHRSFFQNTFTTLSHKVKLYDIPDVCSSDEWNSVIQESRLSLQNHKAKLQNLGTRYEAKAASVDMVIKRLQNISFNNNHLIHTFRQLLENTDSTASELRWPGLISLVLSKGVGYPFQADDFMSKAAEDMIWSTQVNLAQIINLLHCSFVFWNENNRVSSSRSKSSTKEAYCETDRIVNNYFTSLILYKLSTLKNYKVVSLLADVLEALAKTRSRCKTSFRLFHNTAAWEYDAFFPQGLLLANGSQAVLELAGHGENTQQMAFNFGQCFNLAIKANADIQRFWNYQTSQSSSINISSFPVVLHLTSNPETLAYIYSCHGNLDNLDISELNSVLMSNSAMDQARHELGKYVERATNVLQEYKHFKDSEAIEFLFRLVKSLNNIAENG